MKVLTVMVLTKVRCASPLSEAIPFCKTDDEGVDDHDIDEGPIDEGPLREVELRGGFLAVSFPHPQQ
jgi:hypothetical protein